MGFKVYRRFYTLVLVGLLHALAVAGLLQMVVVETAPQSPQPKTETVVALLHEPPAAPAAPSRAPRRPLAHVPLLPPVPYFDPQAWQSLPAPQAAEHVLTIALSACDPGRYDLASLEVRGVCDRIGLALKSDPGHFGVKQDIDDPVHWRRELARREAPVLAPCMSPNGVDVLFTLQCVYETIFFGYDPEKKRRYSE